MKTLVTWYEWSGFAVQLKNHLEAALDELEIEWQECYIENLKEVSDKFKPTMTIHFHPTKLIYDHLETIKQTTGHRLLWDMESPYESDLVFDMAPHFYHIFTSDKNTADELKKAFPGQKIEYVPHACNPKVHKPVEISWEYKSDILFVGNAYESRIKYLQEASERWGKQMLVRIVGVGYRGMYGFEGQHVIHGHINETEMIRYISGAKMVLNIHRLNSDLDMANSRGIQPKHLNNRFYEVMACGRPQMVVGRDDMQEEIERVGKQRPEEYSYKQRLIDYYLKLIK